ncbi:MAG: ABC transporter ATP-binding protein [Candidatus Margulisbacteria bacterium]|nr:ABC transporter ATP-binding protein [Candidatus Margulisiibacteriota bacterium]
MNNIQQDKDYLIRYWQYLKKYKRLLSVSLILIPCITGFHLVQPYLLKVGIDDYITQGNLTGLSRVALFFGMAVVGEFICRALQSFLFQYVGQKTISTLRVDLFRHVSHLSSSYFDKTPKGIITSRLTSDVESLNESFSSGLVTLVGDVLTLIGILVFMSILSLKLTLVTVVFVPPLILIINFFRVKLRFYYTAIRVTVGKITASLQEQLQGVEIVQLFSRESKNYHHFKDLNKAYRKAVLGSVYFDALLYSIVEAMSSIVIAVMLWYGFAQHLNSAITIGVLVAFIDYIQKFFQPLKELSTKFAVLQQALAALEKIFGTFDIQEHIPSGSLTLPDSKGHMIFKEVSFAYPGHEDKPILKNVSLELNVGSVTALVGPTGSGKTTVGRLMSHLYTGYSGHILLDNHPIQDLDLAFLRSQIAHVSQDIQLFSGSIAFNITMGNPKVSTEAAIDAAKRVQAHDFIQKFPDGYDTVLTHQGGALSLGQAQLISFARALACPSPIILLDEATANVDSLSERLIQKATELIFSQKTVLVIAHRLSTIQKADHIYAMKDGEILEEGSHKALMAKDGFYAKLFQLQFSHL